MSTSIEIEGQSLDLSRNEPIAFSVIGFDVLTLGVRSSSFSNVFRVSATSQKNRDIFNSAEIVNSTNPEPYKSLTAVIKVDGEETVNGVASLLGFDGYDYSISIKSGDGNFFNLIKTVSLSSLSSYLTPLTHDYSAAGVDALRDVSTGIVYPNIDYGYFEKATGSTHPFNFFLPSLYLKFIIDSAIELIGYRPIGDVWTDDLYATLALSSKGVVGTDNDFLVNYEFINSTLAFGLLSEEYGAVASRTSTVGAPLNFPSEIVDADGLYSDTTIATLGYTTFAYNFLANFGALTDFDFTFNGNFSTNNPASFFRNQVTASAKVIIRADVYEIATGTLSGTCFSVEFEYYVATYEEQEGSPVRLTETFTPTFPINLEITNPNFINTIAGSADEYAVVWNIESDITIDVLGDIPAATIDNLGNFSFGEISMIISQTDNTIIPSTINVLESFDNINVGSAFLYVCNVMGVFPRVDEYNKTIELIRINSVINKKPLALDWSKKLDLSLRPKVSFKLGGYAQSNYFEYDNDTADPFLNALANFGRGAFTISDTTIDLESTAYKAPYSLCATGLTMTDSRSMAKVFTGNKYTFTGSVYVRDENAKVEGFKTRITKLNRVTDSLIQIESGTTQVANYEVANNNILFQNVLNQNFTLVKDATEKTKIVECLMRLNSVDIEQFDSSLPVWVDYFNDYFYVNNVSEFNLTTNESTIVTLIRI